MYSLYSLSCTCIFYALEYVFVNFTHKKIKKIKGKVKKAGKHMFFFEKVKMKKISSDLLLLVSIDNRPSMINEIERKQGEEIIIISESL